MADRFKIIVPQNFQRWSLGARAMRGGFYKNRDVWEDANDQFFQRTQQYVHVISGRLRDSGEQAVFIEGSRVVGTVAYTAPYAQIEVDRGGDHDFMGRAWEATQGDFQAAMGRAWRRVVAEWNL